MREVESTTERDGGPPTCVCQPSGRLLKVARADNVIAVEHTPGSVFRHRYGHVILHTPIYHISHRGTAKVIPQHARTPRLATARPPGIPEIAHVCSLKPSSRGKFLVPSRCRLALGVCHNYIVKIIGRV